MPRKMITLFCFLLFFRFEAGCTNVKTTEAKTETVGMTVKLKCPRTTSKSLFWIRIVPGTLPEILGRSLNHQHDDPRIRTQLPKGSLDLVITKARKNDTGLYLCLKTGNVLEFLRRADLTVVDSKGDEVTTVHPSDPRPGEHSVSLRCSVPSDSENATSPDEANGRCCGSGPAQPFFSFHCRKNVEASEDNLKGLSSQESGSSFFSHISFSGHVCCSVVKCEETFENRSHPETGAKTEGCQKDYTALYVLSAAFIVGLILIIYLTSKLKNNHCCCRTADFPLQRAPADVSHSPQQTEEEQDLVYALPNITRRKSVRNDHTEREESIYADVRKHSRGAD